MSRALSLRAWLSLSHLLVLALPVLALLLTGAVTRELELEARGQLMQQGEAVAALAAARVTGAEAADLAALGKELTRLGQATRTRIRILDPHGAELVASRVARPPRDAAPSVDLVTVALPLRRGAQELGTVQLSMAPRHPLLAMRLARWRLLGAGGASLLLALLLGLGLAHRISRPLRGLAHSAREAHSGGPGALARLGSRRRSRVAEVGTLARELEGMAGHLEDRLAYIGEFASNVSHELKTPVTTLRSSLELLRDAPELEPELRGQLLAGGLEELTRIDTTISGLLALARAEEGGLREELDLGEALAALKERHPRVHVGGGGGTILADPTQLGLALDNLVANAFQHGGPQVEVRARAWQDGARAGITVEDDGPGISPDNLPRVFERFFTTGGDVGRTGLGLPLVAAVVEASGGEVKAESRPGETLFSLTWPALRDHQSR